MAAYKDIVGQKITKVTSNPGEPKTGQMWYNSTDGKLRGLGITTAWVTGGTYLDNVFGVGLGGPVNAAVGAGGYGPPGPSSQNAAAEYDGSGWTSISNINTARGAVGSSKEGSQTAFWIAGGSSQTGKTEEWNGSSWSEDGDLNTGRRLSGTAGSLTAGLAFGGYASPAGTANSEEYNGTSWSEGNNLGASIYYNTGFGSQTAAISGGGNTGSPDTGLQSAYEYDGTSWTGLTDIGYGFQQGGGHGNTSEGFVYGGSGPPSTYLNTTSEWSGTAWSTIPQTLPSPARAWNGTGATTSGLQLGGSSPSLSNGTTNTNEFTRNTNVVTAAAWASGGALGTARNVLAGVGIQTAALMIGGNNPGATQKGNVEQYDGSSYSEISDLTTARSQSGSAGTSAAAVYFGGDVYPSSPRDTGKTEEYSGSSWSEQNDMVGTARRALTGFGTQTAAVGAGGYGGAVLALTEEYNGSSWTAGNAMPVAKENLAGSGTLTAGITFGGYAPPGPAVVATTEEYDGTNWSSGGALNTGRWGAGRGTVGPQTACLAFGGDSSSPTVQSATEGYDGTSWSTRPSLAAARRAAGGAGTQTANLCSGGYTSTIVTTTEEFTGETTAANITDFTTS